jgi:hypothetical protein
VKRVFLLGASVIAVVVAGCGGSHGALRIPVVTTKQWVAVMSDLFDNGRLDAHHNCGAVVEAVAHYEVMHPPANPIYLRAVPLLDRYAHGVCPRHPQLASIVVGMTDAEVADVAGMPRTPGLRCWLYPVTRDRTGRRVCFDRGRVTLVQVSVHL